MCWSFKENETIEVDSANVEFESTGAFFADIAAYCDAANIRLHPSFREVKEVP